jgi:pimeloyl-ACP methyl ester carboxylesterase
MQTTLDTINLSTVDTGPGRPLVFLHGFPFSQGVWKKQIEAFRSYYRVIAPDLRGFGNSVTQPGLTTMEQYAADLQALLQRLTTGPVVLVGHSMGGYVALAYARHFPEMLRGLVLVSTKAGQDTPEGAAARLATAEKVKAEGVQAVVEAMAPKMLAASNPDALLAQQVRSLMMLSKPSGVIGALLGMAERTDATASLAQIVVPTLVITGADDAVVPPAESEKLVQGIPGSQLEVIPHAGHLVAFEKPEEFNRALKEWLNRESLSAQSPPETPGQL